MAAQAVTVNVATPGTLSTLVGKSETQLTVTGKINALDFDYIRELSALRSLDLSGASVEAYKGDATATSALEYPANVLPDCALLGVPATTLVLPAGIVKIDQGAVGNSAATSIVIPSTVTEIDARAFSSMPALKQVTVPASVKVLGDGAFKDCPLLEKVVILGDLILPASAAITFPALLNHQLTAACTAPSCTASATTAAPCLITRLK